MFHFDFDFLKIFAHQGCLDRYSKWQVFAIQSIMQTLDIKLNYIGVIGFLFPQMRSHSRQISISRLFAIKVSKYLHFSYWKIIQIWLENIQTCWPFYETNECRIFNFDECFLSTRLYKIGPFLLFYMPGKSMHEMGGMF